MGSYDGTLAPDHDGFCPDFAAAAEARAVFDEAEPMATHGVCVCNDESDIPVRKSHVRQFRHKQFRQAITTHNTNAQILRILSHWIVSVIFDVCTIYMLGAREELKEGKEESREKKNTES